ncbi:MAG: hypothetical protein LLF76_08945 [Planctomycetaceae bacterium]|nr:hypothetical protein [Planctomycetaceae bacterium]
MWIRLELVREGRGDFLEEAHKNTPSPLRGTPPCKGGELLRGTFGPEDVFAWIYGVFHSPQYRKRYAEFLKIDFPRVPMPKDRAQFEDVCRIGHELAGLHLMESAALEDKNLQPGFKVIGSMIVEAGYPKYEITGQAGRNHGQAELDRATPKGRVRINETQYFEGVREDVWQFMIGGYQVCEKWLKDRRGRPLSCDDVEHYQKICAAISETIRLMADKGLRLFEE